LEIGAAGELGPDLARDDGHALGRVGAEVELAHVEDADRLAPPVALETDALNLSFEVLVVFEHDCKTIALRDAMSRPRDIARHVLRAPHQETATKINAALAIAPAPPAPMK
jgi:hypothetical protein